MINTENVILVRKERDRSGLGMTDITIIAVVAVIIVFAILGGYYLKRRRTTNK